MVTPGEGAPQGMHGPPDQAGGPTMLEQTAAVLDTNIVQLQGLYAGAGNAVASALETFKVFKPEITRLDGRANEMQQSLGQLDTTMQEVKDTFKSSFDQAGSRMTTMEQRLAAFETFIAALPTWKNDLVSKIDSVGKEARLKAEQLTLKTQLIEDNLSHNVQATRERLDTLTSLAKTATEARAAQSERIEKLEHELKQLGIDSNIRMNDLELTVKRHEVALGSNQRHCQELQIKLGVARADIDGLKERALLLEDVDTGLRSDLAQLRDRQDATDNSINMAASLISKLEMAQGHLVKRIETVERDPRVPRLLAVAEEFRQHKLDTEKYQKAIDVRVDSFDKQLTRLDGKVERGPPGLWKVTEQVAKQSEELKLTQTELRDARRQAESLDRSLKEAHGLLSRQREMHEALQQESQQLQDKLSAGLQRGIRYADALRESLVERHELEVLRNTIGDVKQELQQGISAMGIRVKFDLLHDETAQVADIRSYLQSVDAALARSREKIAVLEEGVMKEQARGRALEAGWVSTKEALDALVLTGELDVHALRRDLRHVKAMMEEMGRLAVRGDIITASQAEQLLEDKMMGSGCLDAALARRLHDGGPLSAALSGLATRYEVEALRKMVLQCRQEVLAAGDADLAEALDTPVSGSAVVLPATPSAAASLPGSTVTSRPQSAAVARPKSAAASAAAASGVLGQPPTLGAASRGEDKPPLRALYERLAAAEEAASCSTQQCSTLELRLAQAEAAIVAAAAAAADASSSAAAVPSGMVGEQASTAANAAFDAPLLVDLEASVREMVNRTLLPEVVLRQAADVQRLVRYIDGQVARMAKQYEVEAVHASVATVRSEVEDLRQRLAARGDQGEAGSSVEAALGTDGSTGWRGRLAAVEEQLAVAQSKLDELSHGVAGPSAKEEAGAAASPDEVGGEDSGKGSSPALQQLDQEARTRAAEARLAAIEGQLARMTRSAPAGSAVSGQVGDGPEDRHKVRALQQELQEMRVLVDGLAAQQPLNAKAFEVDGLRRMLDDLQQLLLQRPAKPGSKGGDDPVVVLPHQFADHSVSQDHSPEAAAAPAAAAAVAAEAVSQDDWQAAVVAAVPEVQQAIAKMEVEHKAVQQKLEQLAGDVAAAARDAGKALHAAIAATAASVNASAAAAGADSEAAGGQGSPIRALHSQASAPVSGSTHSSPCLAKSLAAVPPTRALSTPEHVDTELAGLAHDIVHAAHEEMTALQEGPLPGMASGGLAARQVREAALRRLQGKPLESQRHVELLEKAKQQLSRLIECAAASTVDYLCLGLLMVDIRVKLLEDTAEQQKEQMSSAFNNLESAFEYLRKLQETMDTKASVMAVAGLDRVLRAMARECTSLGPAQDLTGRDGALTGSRLCAPDFWSALLGDVVAGSGAGATGGYEALPSPGSMRGVFTGRSSSSIVSRSRPPTARGAAPQLSMAPLPMVALPGVAPSSPKATAALTSAAIHPPPNFYKEKRNIQEEQERALMASYQQAELQAARPAWLPEHAELTPMLSASQRSNSPPSRPMSAMQRPRTAMRTSSPRRGAPDGALPPLTHLGGGMSLVPAKQLYRGP